MIFVRILGYAVGSLVVLAGVWMVVWLVGLIFLILKTLLWRKKKPAPLPPGERRRFKASSEWWKPLMVIPGAFTQLWYGAYLTHMISTESSAGKLTQPVLVYLVAVVGVVLAAAALDLLHRYTEVYEDIRVGIGVAAGSVVCFGAMALFPTQAAQMAGRWWERMFWASLEVVLGG